MFGRFYTTLGVEGRIAEDDAFSQFVHASLRRYIAGDWEKCLKKIKP